MRYLSVCSGIEAATVAWHPLGWEAAAYSEIEAFPRAVLAHHYPTTPLHGDFTTIQGDEYGPVDLLVGGTPCQSFSIAGLRGGMDDPRGNLALGFLQLARRTRARWVVWENVPGVLSSNGGRDFGAILGGLAELGYGFAYRVLDAQFFGVAQRRRRVFVVGYLGDWRRAAAVLFERNSLSGHPAPRREARKDLAPTISARPTGGGGLGTDFDLDGGCVVTAPTMRAGGNKTGGDRPYGTDVDTCDSLVVAHTLKGEGFDASEDGTGRGAPIVPVCFSAKDHGAGAMLDLSPTLRAGDHSKSHANAGVMSAIAFALRGREGGAMPEVCEDGSVGTLRAADGGSSRDYVAFAIQERAVSTNINAGPQGKGYQEGVAYTLEARNKVQSVSASAVRRLTPVECARLQGFPDDYLTSVPWRGKPTPPDGPQYKALGNSMCTNVMAWIGQRIAAVDAITLQQRAAA